MPSIEHPFQRSALLPTLTKAALCAGLLGAWPAPWTAAADDAVPPISPAPTQQPPRDVRDFAPEDLRGPFDLNTDLRGLFEALGPDAIDWYQHVQTLANPYFGGRVPGTPGIDRAADYIEWWMDQIGLEAAFPEEGEATAAASGKGWTSNRQWLALPGGTRELRRGEMALAGADLSHGEDFVVLGSSGTGVIEAPITFVGYGLREGRDGYTSFDEDTRLDGRIALVFRYEPLNEEGRSRWSDRRFSEHAAIQPKLREVARRGAAGIILVNPPGALHGRSGLEALDTSRWGEGFTIPMVQLSEEAAEKLLTAADPEARSLMTWRTLADEGRVRSVSLADSVKVKLDAEVAETRIRTCNVGGVIPGNGSLKDEWLIIGAHYDHVGMGMFGTSPAYRGQLHPGADDNASGTAALLILARRLMDAYAKGGEDQPRRSILFLAFTAEESGLHGSRYYVQNATVPGDRTTAMLNMDMVGRLRQNRLSVSGTGTAEGFAEILAPHFANSSLTIEANPSGRGPSDHANFYGAGIPVLFPFTGLHDDYHKPGDKAYTVNPAGAVKIVELMEDIALDLATRPDRLVFVSTRAGPGQDRGYGPVRLGVTPGMGAEEVEGVLVEAVAEGSAAQEAGIEPGDLLVAWNGEPMVGTRSLMENLQKHQPGDAVQIVLMRNGERVVVTAKLRESRRRGGE